MMMQGSSSALKVRRVYCPVCNSSLLKLHVVYKAELLSNSISNTAYDSGRIIIHCR